MLNSQKKKLIMVHGIWTGPEGDWFRWVAVEAEKRGFDVIAPQMPNPLLPSLEAWLTMLKTISWNIDENTYFLGHSLGCITIVHLLASLPPETKIGGAVFVAGFCSVPRVHYLDEFCDCQIDWDRIKKVTNKYRVILSTDDIFVPLRVGQDFATKLGAEVIIEKNKGHFTHYAGVFRLPSAFNSLMYLAGEI